MTTKINYGVGDHIEDKNCKGYSQVKGFCKKDGKYNVITDKGEFLATDYQNYNFGGIETEIPQDERETLWGFYVGARVKTTSFGKGEAVVKSINSELGQITIVNDMGKDEIYEIDDIEHGIELYDTPNQHNTDLQDELNTQLDDIDEERTETDAHRTKREEREQRKKDKKARKEQDREDRRQRDAEATADDAIGGGRRMIQTDDNEIKLRSDIDISGVQAAPSASSGRSWGSGASRAAI